MDHVLLPTKGTPRTGEVIVQPMSFFPQKGLPVQER